MSNIIEFANISEEKKLISWYCNGQKIQRVFEYSIQLFFLLNDETGIVVLGSVDEFGKNNALIINADGSTRFFLAIPEKIQYPIEIYDVYYELGILTAVVSAKYNMYAYVFDEQTGEILNVHETR